MRRTEKRLFALTDEVARLREELRQTQAELDVLQHLDDDAVRDAAVGGPIDRDDARATTRDVERFRCLVVDMSARIDRLEAQRTALMNRLDRGDTEH